MKDNRLIAALITTISINSVIGAYFILFEKELLETLFHSTIPFWLLCFWDIFLIISLCIIVYKRTRPRSFSPSNIEDRGFAFMDLNNSTGIAEMLGHQKYSNFLRDTFKHLEHIIEKTEGLEIYQYVGDEVVITWQISSEVANQSALNLLPKFQTSLKKKSKYFKKTYQVEPTFKCAIHGGEVTKTFFGDSSGQAVYHGDVLNTTSRILGLCHQFDTSILLSEKMYTLVNRSVNQHCFEGLGLTDLQGRTKKVSLYKVDRENCQQGSIKTKSFNFSSKMTISQYYINHSFNRYEKPEK